MASPQHSPLQKCCNLCLCIPLGRNRHSLAQHQSMSHYSGKVRARSHLSVHHKMIPRSPQASSYMCTLNCHPHKWHYSDTCGWEGSSQCLHCSADLPILGSMSSCSSQEYPCIHHWHRDSLHSPLCLRHNSCLSTLGCNRSCRFPVLLNCSYHWCMVRVPRRGQGC